MGRAVILTNRAVLSKTEGAFIVILNTYSTVSKTAGSLFVAAGLLKLVFAQREFAAALVLMGAPLPQVTAIGVPLLEILGGMALCLNRWPRPFAALLAADMAAALMLVGMPGLRGKTETVGGYTIGGEAWRAPLELALLAAMIYIAVTKQPDAKA